MLTLTALFFREGMKVSQSNLFFQNNHNYESMVLRLLFKPDTGSIWGYHKLNCLPLSSKRKLSDQNDDLMNESADENEVDLDKTMWLVLRGTKQAA